MVKGRFEGNTPPKAENVEATKQDYENAHPDFRSNSNGIRKVIKLTRDKGTILTPIEEDKEENR